MGRRQIYEHTTHYGQHAQTHRTHSRTYRTNSSHTTHPNVAGLTATIGAKVGGAIELTHKGDAPRTNAPHSVDTSHTTHITYTTDLAGEPQIATELLVIVLPLERSIAREFTVDVELLLNDQL